MRLSVAPALTAALVLFSSSLHAQEAAPPERAALEDALRWLASAQAPDGSWQTGLYENSDMYSVGLTGLAVLAFQGAGHTTQSGPYKQTVAAALRWLVSRQDEESGLVGEREGHSFLYDHAVATLALCEALELTENAEIYQPARRAVHFALRARNPYGAWRYDVPPIGDNDTSVTSWMVQALVAAQRAKIGIDDDALVGALNWIDEVTDPATGRIGYDSVGSSSSRIVGINDHFPTDETEAMTAAGLWCRLLLGQEPERTPIVNRHARLLARSLPRWDEEGQSIDLYYWYYGSCALRRLGGEDWTSWSATLKEALLPSQRTEGEHAGSWDPVDPWGVMAGRVYSTALAALCLEAEWRAAPPALDDAPAEAAEPEARELPSLAGAARAGVDWLVENQGQNGSWTRTPTADDPTNAVGLTALGVLALVGDEREAYLPALDRALVWLREQQDDETGLVGEQQGHTFLYNHAIATLALCEAYRAAPNERLEEAAQKAVSLACRARNPYGAWRYDLPPTGDNDTSVTGWMVRALKAAELAGLTIDSQAYEGAAAWIDAATDAETGRVGYDSPGSQSSRVMGVNDRFPSEKGEAMTAVGILVRLLVGQDPVRRPILMRHAELCLRKVPEWEPETFGCDMYYWYHGTLALRALGGRAWEAWRAALERTLLPSQVASGPGRGSWEPVGPWGYAGGRTYSTALMTLALQAAQ